MMSARLAEVLTVVSSVEVLSELSWPNTPDAVSPVLVLLVDPEASAFSTRSLHDALPILIVVRFHPTTPAVRVPPPVAETKLVPAGIASDRLTPVASDGPERESTRLNSSH